MKLRRLVPALAVLTMAGEAAALEQVAPVTSLTTGDALLTPVNDGGNVADAGARYHAVSDDADPSPAIDLDDLGDRLFAFSIATGWRDFATGIAPDVSLTTSGIAIVSATMDEGVSGHWEYRDDVAGSWSSLDLSGAHEIADDPATSETDETSSHVVLLPLNVGINHKQLRFVPDASSGSGYASVSFRVWDGSDLGTSTRNNDPFAPQTFGGSPTAFSAETRTLKVHVIDVNDAPELNGAATAPSLTAFIPKTVGDLLATTNPFFDPDGDSGLGIAITASDVVDAGWEYSLDGGSAWNSLAGFQPGSGTASLLGPDALLRHTGGVGGGSGLLTVHAWDQTGGISGNSIPLDSSVSGSSIGVDVLANDAPTIDDVSGADYDGVGTLTVQRGQSSEFTIEYSDSDADDVLARSAASLNYSGGGTLDVVSSSPGSVTYRYTPGSADPDTVRFELMDLPGDAGEPTHVITQDLNVVLANTLPDISAVDGTTYTVRLGGPDLFLDFDSSDLNGDTLLWSATLNPYAAGTLSPIALSTGPSDGNSVTYTPSQVGTDTLTVTVNDGYGDSTITITINVEPPNNTPTVALAGASAVTVHVGDEIDLSVLLTSDDADGDSLDWGLSSLAYGTAVLGYSTTSATAGNTAYYTPYSVGTDTLTITVTDPFGGTSNVSVTITVLPAINQPPTITSISRGDFAIVGQPFEAVVRADDANADDLPLLSLAAVEYGGAPVRIRRLGDGLWRVTWTPETEGSGLLSLTVTDPADASAGDSFSLTYVAAPTPVSLPASLPTSSAGNIVYGAIAPGSNSAFAVLNSFLNGQPRSVARAFWWTGGGYAELPENAASDPLRAGVFLASTVPTNLTFAPPTQPAPFAITLRAGQWTFFGIPPLMLNSGGGSETSHPWSEIELQTTDGQSVDLATKLAAIGPADGVSDADTQPWQYRWDLSPATYQRTSSISSGTGYWLRNRSGVDYRLVRQAVPLNLDLAMHARPAAAAAAARPVSTADMPPAPPAGGSVASTSAEGGGGSCGAGGLAGLLIAGLALIGLRPRRRN